MRAQEAASEEKREVMVKEVVLDSAVVDITYLGAKHECVLLTTKSKRLYFSEDSGQNWVEATEKVDTGDVQVERVLVSPTDKTVVTIEATRHSLVEKKRTTVIYVSENSGKTWRRVWGKRKALHSWIYHPKEKQWAIASWWMGDCDGTSAKVADTKDEKEQANSEASPCVHKLMFTRDLGRSFVEVSSYVVQFSWGSAKLDQANRIFFTSYKKKSGDQGRLALWTREVDFSYVDVNSRGRVTGSITEVLPWGNKFVVSNDFVLVATVRDEVTQTVALMVSKDGGKSFKPALLPSGMGELEEKWYTVLDTSEGAVILHIANDETGPKDSGRIYVSDPQGYKFSQSLTGNVRSSKGECEFDKIVCLEGVYMANIVVPSPAAGSAAASFSEEAQKAADDVEKEAADGSQVDKKHKVTQSSKPAKAEKIIHTVISFDKGGAWSYLKPPRVDSKGKAYDCVDKPIEQCALHLHGTTSWDFYAPFYSIESAVGIIMGTGNVGSTLRFEPDETNTFLSRDGGLTWVEAHKGAFIYEFGDHGGLIVMADDLKKTTEVVFTWNEGQSWYDFGVSKTPFEVDNIITEPNTTSTTFLMFGTRTGGEGVLYYMAFDSLQFPQCKGAWAADSVSSDYETWSPSDGSSTANGEAKCLLGQQVTYTRRKRTSQCFNGEQFERPVVNKKCACTMEDFQCEIGFSRAVGATECVYAGQDMVPASFFPEICKSTYLTPAYRRVSGDQCEGGWQAAEVEVPCPSSPMLRYTAKWGMLLTLIAGLAYIIYARFFTASKPDIFGDVKGSSTECSLTSPIHAVIDCFRWMMSKVRTTNQGFGTYENLAYKKVGGNEFDLDVQEEALTDFIDEDMGHDDYAPRVYDSAPPSRQEERPATRREDGGIVSGTAHLATEQVPKLAMPPSVGGVQTFDIGNDEELL